VPTAIVIVLGVLAIASIGGKQPQRREPAALRQKGFRPVPVIMVVLDEFPVASIMNRAGNVDRRLFPNFRRLKEDSVWFRNTAAVGTFTKYAIPALLTGKHQEPGSPVETYPSNIFTLLGDAYSIHTIEPLPGICPPELCNARVPAEIAPGINRQLGPFAGYDRGANFAAFLETIEVADEPRFYFLHLVIPHSPWRYLPSGQLYLDGEPIPGQVDIPGPGRGWVDDKWLVTQAFQRHLLQVRLVDKMIGALIRRLKTLNLYRKSALIVTADHGLGFKPGLPKRVIVQKTAGDLTAVPFFLKRPYRRAGRVSDAPVETTDIVPTIADMLNLSDVWRDVDGMSALGGSIPRDRVRVVNGIELEPRGREKYALVERKYRWFASGGDRVDLHRTGPGRSDVLVGRPLEELAIASGGDAIAYVKTPQRFRSVTPDADPFPALLHGRVRATEGGPVEIAVAVNGRIAAVTRSFLDREVTRFYCVLPPSAFDEPPNRLELFVVEDVQRGTLSALEIRPSE
jgi:hypothetical protein